MKLRVYVHVAGVSGVAGDAAVAFFLLFLRLLSTTAHCCISVITVVDGNTKRHILFYRISKNSNEICDVFPWKFKGSRVSSSLDDVIPLCVSFLHRPIKFEVWDRDNRWNDDLLGSAKLIPTMGRNINRKYQLKHGSLYVRVTALCAPSLQGSLCEQYAASPSYEDVMGYMKKEEEHWGSGMSGPDGSIL